MSPQRRRGRGGDAERLNRLSAAIIGAAITVHRTLGPGLLESTYEVCLQYELKTVFGFEVERQSLVPIRYRDLVVEDAFRFDLEVSDTRGTVVLVEVKAAEKVIPIHEAQLLTYLKMLDLPLGLIINFNVEKLVDGVTRMVHEFPEDALRVSSAPSAPLR